MPHGSLYRGDAGGERAEDLPHQEHERLNDGVAACGREGGQWLRRRAGGRCRSAGGLSAAISSRNRSVPYVPEQMKKQDAESSSSLRSWRHMLKDDDYTSKQVKRY